MLASFEAAVETLRGLGAEVVEVSCPHFEYALAAYYLIAPSECSSNLARFDAVRYGLRVGDDGANSLEDVMSITREAGFGAEVKRRIMIGTYALSSGYYEAYYGQAQKVRTLIARDFAAAFERADVLVSPTSPFVAFGSASGSTTRWRCTSTTSARCRRRWPARRRSRCRAGCPRGCRSGCRSWPRPWPTTAATASPRPSRPPPSGSSRRPGVLA